MGFFGFKSMRNGETIGAVPLRWTCGIARNTTPMGAALLVSSLERHSDVNPFFSNFNRPFNPFSFTFYIKIFYYINNQSLILFYQFSQPLQFSNTSIFNLQFFYHLPILYKNGSFFQHSTILSITTPSTESGV